MNFLGTTLKYNGNDIYHKGNLLNPCEYKKGTGTFSSGLTTYNVNDAFVTSNTMITVTVTGGKTGYWSVESFEGYFKITSDATEKTSVTFIWEGVK